MSSDVFWNICVHLLTERTSVMGIPDRGILFGFAFLVFCWFQFPYPEAARECVVKVWWLKKKCNDIKMRRFCFFFNLRPSSSMNGSVHPSVFPSICLSVCHTFFAATKQLYEWFSPSVCMSIRPSVAPFWLCSHHCIIMNFQELLPKTEVMSLQGVKVRSQRSRSQRSQPNFRNVTPVWIHIWWWNDAYSLIMLRRGALLFFKVMRQISRSHGSKKIVKFNPDWAFPDKLQFEFTNGYEMLHNAWSSLEEVPYSFWRSFVQFQGHAALTIVEFDPN